MDGNRLQYRSSIQQQCSVQQEEENKPIENVLRWSVGVKEGLCFLQPIHGDPEDGCLGIERGIPPWMDGDGTVSVGGEGFSKVGVLLLGIKERTNGLRIIYSYFILEHSLLNLYPA